MSLRMLQTLHGELASCVGISKIRAIIIAASPPIFSAGHDLRELVLISFILSRVLLRIVLIGGFIRFLKVKVVLFQRSSEGQAKHAEIMAKCSELMNQIQDMHLPVIAEVKGVAAAAGCQLAASCDIVIAADNAKFSVPG